MPKNTPPFSFRQAIAPDPKRFVNIFDELAIIDYFRNVRAHFGSIHFLGLPEFNENNRDVSIESLFVQPLLSTVHLFAEAFEGPDIPETIDLLKAFVEHQRLVILGDPGSGKSTIIRWLADSLCQITTSAARDRLGPLVPVPLILRDLPLSNKITWKGLLNYFLSSPFAIAFKTDKKLFYDLIAKGQIYFLLDGIDEISSVETRKAIRDAVWMGFSEAPRCRWILTSRIVGYNEVPFHKGKGDAWSLYSDVMDYIGPKNLLGRSSSEMLRANEKTAFAFDLDISVFPKEANSASFISSPQILKGFEDVMEFDQLPMAGLLYVSPFNDSQIETFARHWYTIQESSPHLAKSQPEQFVEAIRENSGTRNLARLPNLLTLMALIFRTLARLPDGRASLYGKISEAYLKTIDEFRKLQSPRPFSLAQKMRWLAYIAWQMQQRRANHVNDESTALPEIVATADEVKKWLAEAMRSELADETEDASQLFLDYVTRRSGLLLERGVGQFAFLHLSFQEFFAAHFLREEITGPDWLESCLSSTADQPSDVSLKKLREYAKTDIWREIFIFLFEMLGEQSSKWPLKLIKLLFEEILNKSLEDLRKSSFSDYPFTYCALLASIAVNSHCLLDSKQREELLERCWALDLSGYNLSSTLTSRSDILNQSKTALQKAFNGRDKFDLIRCNRISDLSLVSQLVNLERLTVNGCYNLKSLDGIQSLTKLGFLDVDDSLNLRDISALSNLPNLHTLFFIGSLSNVPDFTPLSKIQSLTYFGASYSALRKLFSDKAFPPRINGLLIMPSQGLKDLQFLNGVSSQLKSLQIIAAPRLEIATCADMQMNLSTLSIHFAEKLKELDISLVKDVIYLTLEGCPDIHRLDVLKGHSKVQYLRLENVSIQNLESVKNLSVLEDLNLFAMSKLESLKGIETFRLLKKLRLASCSSLKDISGLNGTNVEDIVLYGDLSNLKLMSLLDLQRLKTLKLPDSMISDNKALIADLRKQQVEVTSS